LLSRVCSFLLRWTTKDWISFDGEKRRAYVGFHHEFLMTPIRRATHHDGDKGCGIAGRSVPMPFATGLSGGRRRRKTGATKSSKSLIRTRRASRDEV